MSTIVDRYFQTLAERLETVRATQGESIDAAARIAAGSIAAGKLVFTFGTGHGSLPAIESFPRTGTIVGFRPIVESSMISFHRVLGDMGARQYRSIRRKATARRSSPRTRSSRATAWSSSRTPASTR
jgi:uncharacterized phosphosugar-binding protein